MMLDRGDKKMKEMLMRKIGHPSYVEFILQFHANIAWSFVRYCMNWHDAMHNVV